MEKNELINALISALNGDDWQDANIIYNKIIETGDIDLIVTADEIFDRV